MDNRLFCALLFLLLPCFLFCKQSSLDAYKSKDCDPNKRCFSKILHYLVTETNEQFIQSHRMKTFQKFVKFYEKSDVIDNNSYFVYAILDNFLINEVLKKQKFESPVDDTVSLKPIYSQVFHTLSKSFVFIGADKYAPMRQPLFYAKSQCPEKNVTFVNDYYSPASLYICISVWEAIESTSSPSSTDQLTSENVPTSTYLDPIIVFTSKAAADKVKNALIYYLNDMLVNYEDVSSYNVNPPNADDHFLAHYALEYMFRFFSIGHGSSKYSHKDLRYFPLHEDNGVYFDAQGHLTIGRVLIYQGKFMYKFTPPTIKSAKLPPSPIYIRLPFAEENSDYIMSKKANKLVVNLIMKYAVVFQINAPNVYRCLKTETKKLSVSTNKSLKTLVEALYTSIVSCATKDEPSIDLSKFNYALFQRVRAKFEFTLAMMLYVFNKDDYTIYNFEKKYTKKRIFPSEIEFQNSLNKIAYYVKQIDRDENQEVEWNTEDDEDELNDGFDDVEKTHVRGNHIDDEEEEEKEDVDENENEKYIIVPVARPKISVRFALTRNMTD